MSSIYGNKVQEIQRQYMQQSRIPGIVGAIDCTYIPIQSPGLSFDDKLDQ
jgi:hypothetical protein